MMLSPRRQALLQQARLLSQPDVSMSPLSVPPSGYTQSLRRTQSAHTQSSPPMFSDGAVPSTISPPSRLSTQSGESSSRSASSSRPSANFGSNSSRNSLGRLSGSTGYVGGAGTNIYTALDQPYSMYEPIAMPPHQHQSSQLRMPSHSSNRPPRQTSTKYQQRPARTSESSDEAKHQVFYRDVFIRPLGIPMNIGSKIPYVTDKPHRKPPKTKTATVPMFGGLVQKKITHRATGDTVDEPRERDKLRFSKPKVTDKHKPKR